MSTLRMCCIYDSGINAYLRPFFADYRENAIRSFRGLVNDRSNRENMVANHPEQFVLFDLGEFDADLELSLWYTLLPYGSLKPVLAEISFKYSDPNANFTRKVVDRAALSFSALKGLTQYNASTSTATKTQFVYQYQSNFCN